MKKKLSLILIFLLSSVLISYSIYAYSNINNVGRVVVKARSVFIERNGKSSLVSGFGAFLALGDKIKTGPTGKALVTLKNGDTIFLSHNSELVPETPKNSQGFSNQVLRILGKIRAKIQKTKTRNVRFATPNAVIGIKGTDFVVEYKKEQTSVATVEGLVNLASPSSGGNIDIPPGKMSTISAAGEVMPLREIAGDIMSDVESAGAQLKANESAGEKVTF